MYRQQNNSMTGKSVRYVEKAIVQFNHSRTDDEILQRMTISEYYDEFDVQNAQIKYIDMELKDGVYQGHIVRIRVQFSDHFPFIPPKMYVEPSKFEKSVYFLHANVYHDIGQICHPLLEQVQKTNSTNFSEILRQIYKLIPNPNFNNAANLHLANIYLRDQAEYQRLIKQNVQSLQKWECQIQEDQIQQD